MSNLTSSSSSSTDKHGSKVGRCAGVFLQLFDWNRRLQGKRFPSQKMLPAERKHVSNARKDEKLPMAKLLLIADESTGGLPCCDLPDGSNNPDKKKPIKKAPNVVARLMGLETMPSPEPFRAKMQEFDRDYHRPPLQDCGEVAHLPLDSSTTMKQKPMDKCSACRHSIPSSTKESLKSSSFRKENHVQSDEKHSTALIRHNSSRLEELKPMFFCKLPALSPRQIDCTLRSILSPKSHTKLASPIKSPLASKSAARLFEEAVKILEPSMQTGMRIKNLGVRSHVVRSLLMDGDGEPSVDKKVVEPSQVCRKRKPANKASLQGSEEHVNSQGRGKKEKTHNNGGGLFAASSRLQPGSNKRVSPVHSSHETLHRSGSAREETACLGQTLQRSWSAKEDAKYTKLNHRQQDKRVTSREEKKYGKEEQSCRRISRSKRDMYLNQSKITDVAKEAVTSKVSNCVSTDSVVTSVGGSHILNYGKLFGSRKASASNEGNKMVIQKSQCKEDFSLMKSILKRRVTASVNIAKQNAKQVNENKTKPLCNEESPLPSEKMSLLENESFFSRESTSEGCFAYKTCPSNKNVDMVSADSWSDNSNATKSSGLVAEINTGCHEGNRKQVKVTRNVSDKESSCVSRQGVSEEDAGNTTSSYIYPHSTAYRVKQPVSYSGKTTAAILEELLKALNSPKVQSLTEDLPWDGSEVLGITNMHSCSLERAIDRDVGPIESSGTSIESSQCFIDSSVQDVDLMARGCQSSFLNSEVSLPYYEKCLQGSPISTLHCPFLDESSDSCESAQESEQKPPVIELSDCASSISGQCHKSDEVTSAESKEVPRYPNKLVDSVSPMYHLHLPILGMQSKVTHLAKSEEEYVKLIVNATNCSIDDIFAARLQLCSHLLDPTLFEKLEEQIHDWEWGIILDEDSRPYRSEIDSRFTWSQHKEVAFQNRKVFFDCVSEITDMSLGITGKPLLGLVHPMLSSAAPLCWTVYRQINEWREMAFSPNIDEMVAKEMNAGIGRWTDFKSEASEIAMEMEKKILRALIEDVVGELWTTCGNTVTKSGY